MNRNPLAHFVGPESPPPVVVEPSALPTDEQLAGVHEQLDEACWRNNRRLWLTLAALGLLEVPG